MAADRFQQTLWTILVLALVGVGGAYFVLDSKPVQPLAAPLPVIGSVKPFSLTNQLGATVTEVDLRGQVVVADVIFSRCPTLCLRLSQQMARLQTRVPAGVRLLSLTADPAFDTPTVLAKHGQRHGAEAAKWWFLTGPKAEVYRLATNSLLFAVMENPEPEPAKLEDLFIHSADFKIVDRLGRLRAVVYGEETNAVERILSLVTQLQREHCP
jgi:protein SCO1/2